MNKAGFDVVVGSFKKNDTIYHAAINAPLRRNDTKKQSCEYKVLLSQPQKKTVSFKIKMDEEGRWIPDKKTLVDPWIADNIGSIIEKKIIDKTEV